MAKNPAQETAVVRANVNRQTVVSDGFVSIYANDTQLQLSPWDVRLIFGVIDEVATQEKPFSIVKLLGEVRMSLHHAKKVAEILAAHIELYEKATGGQLAVPD